MYKLMTAVFKKFNRIALSVIIMVTLFVILWSDRLMLDKNGLGFEIASERTISTSDPSTLHENLVSPVIGTERPKKSEQMCDTFTFLNNSNGIPLRGRFFNNRSMYYCNIPKCGSTFLSLFVPAILQCTNLCEESVQKYDKLVVRRPMKKTQELIDNAYSFVFVREPYARLLSAYENKLFNPNEFWTTLGVQIIRSVRDRASCENITIGYDVTFRELVEHVLQFHEQGLELNRHLAPMSDQCSPCKLKFNFIGKLETMYQDLVNLVDDWKVKGNIVVNRTATVKQKANSLYKHVFGPYRHMFNIIKMFGRQFSRFKLFQRAWSSYQVRGFILNKFEMPFKESEVVNVDQKRYETELKKAIVSSRGHEDALKVQREEALIQAYRSLPLHILMKLSKFTEPDCLLFGYDNMPPKLFNRNSISVAITHKYFKGL